MPFVSIIMPAFNTEEFIAESINSVLKQTFAEWELIIVDDGSTDGTAAIAKDFESKDSRIKYIYQANKKQAAARNTGIRQATGKWIAFLDADDIWYPNKLQRQFEATREIDADVVYTAGFLYNHLTNEKKDYQIEPGYLEGHEMYGKLYDYNPVPILSVLVKREWIDKVGQQDERPIIVGCEDLDYWIRLAKAGASFYGIAEPLFLYRVNPYGTSKNTLQMSMAKAAALLKSFDEEQFPVNKQRAIFKSFFDHLIHELFQKGKLTEIKFLYGEIAAKASLEYIKINNNLIRSLGSRSSLAVRIITKIDSLINGKGLQKELSV